MKIDFHTHVQAAKELPLSESSVQKQLQAAKHAKLDAICLTAHFDFEGLDRVYQFLEKTCTREGDCLVTEEGLKIFPGLEIETAEGGQVLAIGSLESALELSRQLRPYQAPSCYLPVHRLAEKVSQAGMLFGMAHPYREGSYLYQLPREDFETFDFIELNAQDMAGNRSATKHQVKMLANRYDLPLVVGSETRQALQFGCVWNNFERDCTTVAELRREMRAGRFERFAALNFQAQVESAALARRAELDAFCKEQQLQKIV